MAEQPLRVGLELTRLAISVDHLHIEFNVSTLTSMEIAPAIVCGLSATRRTQGRSTDFLTDIHDSRDGPLVHFREQDSPTTQ